ncbi:MAG: hypothetical protein FJY75_13705 [Candidatus Eisenbacteria bacterium]|uniref:Uncharacterized protein n=1 Tax=Eiseniibacteriota bacterium TaxID=2212470 RepID=A0A937XFE8_UNCEI|nr:hypothetical protein [Candidatus Eisenbacteria bacterium]
MTLSIRGSCAAVGLLVLCGARAVAGPHAGGIVLAHLNPAIEYTSSVSSYQGMSGLEECKKAIVEGRVDAERAQVWFVLASFENSRGPVNLGGAGFGFGDYDGSRLQFSGFGPCNDGFLELPSNGWPGPREGTALVFQDPRRRDVEELYWFASYAYGIVTVPLAPAPHFPSSQFASRDTPPVEDEAEDFGSIGFGTPGYNPCGQVSARGACCLFSRCAQMTRDECEGRGGRYLGDNTACFPDPCAEEQIQTTWGTLKKIYE